MSTTWIKNDCCTGYNGHHAVTCPNAPREVLLTAYTRARDELIEHERRSMARWRRTRDHALLWEGKCLALRQENNALRRKLYPSK